MRSSRFLALGALLFGAGLAACGGGPQGYSPPIATPVPVASAAPVTAAPGTSSPGAGTTATPSPGASTVATATPTPLVPATAQPEPTIGGGSAPPVTTPPPSTPTPVGTAAPTITPTTLPAGEKIYVVNHGIQGDDPSVTIYPVAATAASTPVATLAGGNTQLQQPYFDAVDANGTLYVSNQSNAPGNATSGYVTEYAAMGQSGNQPPVRTITGLDDPEGVAVDASGNLYVAELYQINVYAPGASGNATPIRVIGGTMTTLSSFTGPPAGLFVDPSGDLFVAVGPAILEFAPGATGNVAPTANYGGNALTTAGDAEGSLVLASCLSAVASGTTVYGVNYSNNTYDQFVSTTTGVAIPAATSNEPFGLFIDTNGMLFSTNAGSSALFIFSSTTTFATGLPTTTVSGTTSGLNVPYGVTAR